MKEQVPNQRICFTWKKKDTLYKNYIHYVFMSVAVDETLLSR